MKNFGVYSKIKSNRQKTNLLGNIQPLLSQMQEANNLINNYNQNNNLQTNSSSILSKDLPDKNNNEVNELKQKESQNAFSKESYIPIYPFPK